MPHATTYAKLRELSTADLIRLYDTTAVNTEVGLGFLREEIALREAEVQGARIVGMTKHMRDLTIVIAVLTVVNVLCAGILLLK